MAGPTDLNAAGFGRLVLDGRDLGATFAISATLALTAAHVVRDSAARPLEFVSESDGTRIPVGAPAVDDSLDAAILPLLQPVTTTLAVGRPIEGASWKVTTRPRPTDPGLTGTVTDIHRRLLNSQGREVSLLQLAVDQNLGDYRGYSGSAVTLASPQNAVVGILVEQGRWRSSSSEPPPVANVLFALPIATVIQCFALDSLVRHVSAADLIPTTVQASITRIDAVFTQSLELSDRRLITRHDEDILRTLRSGLVGLREALASTSETTRNNRLGQAETSLHEIRGLPTAGSTGRVPNSQWLAICQMGFWLIHSLRGDDDAALGHALQTFIYEPHRARAQYFPDLFGSLIRSRCLDLEAQISKQRNDIEQATSFPALENTFIGIGLAIGVLQILDRNSGNPSAATAQRLLAKAGRTDMLRAASLNALNRRSEYQLDRKCQEVAAAALAERQMPVPRVPRVKRPVKTVPLYVAFTQRPDAAEKDEAARESARLEHFRRYALPDLRTQLAEYDEAEDWPGIITILRGLEQVDPATAAEDPYIAFGTRASRELAKRIDKPHRIVEKAHVKQVCWHPDGTRLAITDHKWVRIYDVSSSEIREQRQFRAGKGLSFADRIAFSPDGTRLAVAIDWGRIRVLDALSGSQLFSAGFSFSTVAAVVFSPDGTRLAAAINYKTRIWDVRSGKQILELDHPSTVNSVAFSPDGACVATASDTARIWDAATGAELLELPHDNKVDAIAFSPDGACVATASDTARIWDAATGAELLELPHDNKVDAIAFSPDGSLVATACYFARIWDAATGDLLEVRHSPSVNWTWSPGVNRPPWATDLAAIRSLTFSPDGTRLATVGNQQVDIWLLS